MTLQEFKLRREQLNRRMLNAQKQLDRLEQEFVKSLPIKTGNTISIRGSFVGWLVSINASIYQWEVKYNPPKKDGTQSNRILSNFCEISDIQLFTN